MSCITVCMVCGQTYEESSEEMANSPDERLCPACYSREAPQHGAERNRRLERQYQTDEFRTASGPVSLTYCSDELTVAERYCGQCKEWVSTQPLGLLGHVWCPQCKSAWRE